MDIFGFENFIENSLEQLSINYTNEKLQQLYIHYIFKSEEKEFIEEGLKNHLKELTYQDNQLVIDLIDKYPLGIFNLLDESTFLGSGNDENLYKKICKTHKENCNFSSNKMIKDKFYILHTACLVEYCIYDFRAKNKDEFNTESLKILLNSHNSVIKEIFSPNSGFLFFIPFTI